MTVAGAGFGSFHKEVDRPLYLLGANILDLPVRDVGAFDPLPLNIGIG